MNKGLEIKLFLSAIILGIVSYLFVGDLNFMETLDIQLHDTYIVFVKWHLLSFFITITLINYIISIVFHKVAYLNKISKFSSLFFNSTTALVWLITGITFLIFSIDNPLPYKFAIPLIFLGNGILSSFRSVLIWRV